MKDGVFYLSASALDTFCKCPRLYYYQKVLRRETVAVKTGRTYGKIIHKALALPAGIGRITKLEKEFATTDLPVDDYRKLDYATAQTGKYEKKYPTEPWTIAVRQDGTPAIEVAFTLPLFDISFGTTVIPIVWTGIIDKVIQWPDGAIEHLDHKTSSVGGKGIWDEYYNNNAQIGYCWALNEMGFKSTGFLMDVLIGRPPTPTGVAHEFLRQRFTIDASQLAEWKTNVASIVKLMLYCYYGEFPYYRTSCKALYGRCDFFDLDSYPQDVRLTLLKGDGYQDVKESPIHTPMFYEKDPLTHAL